MLRRLLDEIAQSEGPLLVDELARRLALDPEVVSGMIRFLEAKGWLRAMAAPVCPPGCGAPCRDGCPLLGWAPVLTPDARAVS